MAKKRRKFTQCPNCGYTFEEVNNYCPNCGQENHDLNVPVKHLLLEFLEGTLHYDTKFWHTLKDLLFRPGLATIKFNEGKRASYVPPFRLYVFVSIVFFFLLALSSDKVQFGSTSKLKEAAPEVATDPQVAAALEVGQRVDSVASEKLKFEIMGEKIEKEIPEGAALRDKFLKNMPFMMFLLMPFFGFLLYLFYFKQRRNYVEHLMFSIHLHTFYFLLMSFLILTDFALPSLDLGAWSLLLMLVYTYFALHRVYKQSYLATFLKFIPITLSYSITLTLFLIGTIAISILI